MSKPIYLFSTSTNKNAINVNSLKITLFKPLIEFSKYDYFIITSKQTSKALLQYDYKTYCDTKALCISEKTAQSYEKLGANVLEIGTGYGDNLREKITSYDKKTKWLYLRAKRVASDFVSLCKNDGFNIDEIVVYESECSKDILDITIKKDAILIFTSPSSVNCYLKKHSLLCTSNIIVIGKTTAKELPKNSSYILSPIPTIENCMEIAQTL